MRRPTTTDDRGAARRGPPEVPGAPVLGNLPELRADALRFFLRARREHGDVVRFAMGPRRPVLVAHPDVIQHVLVDNNTNYRKDAAYDKLKPVLGEGLLTSEGEAWLRQRRLIQPLFHRRRIDGFADTMVACARAMVEGRWQGAAARGETLDVAAEMMRLTLEVVGWTLFSTDVSADAERVGRALTVALRHGNARIRSLVDLPESLPTPGNLQFRESQRLLDEVVFGLIRERRAQGLEHAPQDLLTMLLSARDADTGAVMSDRQVRDEAMTLFLAGHETTANLLAWAFHLLARNPGERRRLEAEVDEVLGGRPAGAADAQALPRVRRVLDETLRLFPPAWVVGRRSLAPDELGGYAIEADTDVVISPYVTHRHPDLWQDPEGFDPDRFLPERSAGRPRYAYLPFGAGPRLCIGNAFALMEAQLVLATVLQRVRLEGVPGHPAEPRTMVTLRPRDGLPMRVQQR